MCETLHCANDVAKHVCYIEAHFSPEDALVYASVCEKCLPDLRTSIHEMGKRVGPVMEV